MGRALVVIRSDTDRRKATEITLEVLKALLRYDPADGAFYRQDGTRAGTKRRDGYRQIVIGGRQYLEHRLASTATDRTIVSQTSVPPPSRRTAPTPSCAPTARLA
jgi:hypothetical protein